MPLETPSTSVQHVLRGVARDYRWLHTLLGILGNLAFFIGSVFFLFEALTTAGIWLFIVGALGMLVSSVGSALIQHGRASGT